MRLTVYYYLPENHGTGWPCGLQSSPTTVASRRLRAEIPAKSLAQRGHEVKVTTRTEDFYPLVTDVPKILIIPKVSSSDWSLFNQQITEAIRVVTEAHELGIKVVIDYSDDLVGAYDHRSQGTLKMLQNANAVVCSSPLLTQRVRGYIGKSKPVITIFDPVEGVRQEPHADSQEKVTRILWFGHATNLDALLTDLGELEAISKSYLTRLEILTQLQQPDASRLMARLKHASSSFPCHIHWWSGPSSLSQALSRSQVVFLPVDLNSPKRFASNNRITEAVWGGCFVVAAPVDSYMPFINYALITNRPAEGLRKYLSRRDPVNELIAMGQQLISRAYTPSVIGSEWERFLLSLA